VPASQPSIVCTNCGLDLGGDALFCPKCGTARSRDVNGDPLMGAVIGDRFLILERLGHGGSGTIYRAEHITLRRKVAVKVLHHELSRDDLAVERFRREATTVSEIDNDHIVEIHDFGHTADGRLYLAMELLEGETLQDVIRRERRLSVEQTIDVLLQLGEALAEAHAMGYVHRDLRPRNLWLSARRGRKGFVKLLDFGLAKLVENEGRAASTSLGMTFGDPKYMSPEQARGEAVDRRADIYSMGCIAYEMLVGEPPFVGGKVFDILTRHTDTLPGEPRERRDDVPAWLNDVIMRMLAKKHEDRFITVLALIEALRQQTVTPVLAGGGEGAASASGTFPAAPASATTRSAGESGVRKLRARTSTMLYGQSPEDESAPPVKESAPEATIEANNEGKPEAKPEGKPEAKTAAKPEAKTAAKPEARNDAKPATKNDAKIVTTGAEPRAGGPAAASAGADAVEAEQRRSAGARKTSPGVPVQSAATTAGASAAFPAQTDRERPAAAEAARVSAPRPDATAVSDRDQPGKTPVAVNPAVAPGASPVAFPGASGAAPDEQEPPAASASSAQDSAGKAKALDAGDSLSGSGLSGDWFADAAGGLNETGRQRLDKARAFADSGDTSLVGHDGLFVDPGRKRLFQIAAIVGGAILVIVIIALLWPGGDGAPEKTAAATPPDARPAGAAAIMAGLADAASAPPASASNIDAGAAAIAVTAATPSAVPTPSPSPAPAARPETSPRPAPASRTTPKPDTRPAQTTRPPAPPRERPEPEPAGDSAGGGNASENAKQAVFFAKMGEQALRNGDMFGAARHFKQALDLDPKNADAILGQGQIAYSQGSYANAIAHFEKAARMRPRSAQVHVLLGQAYLGAGNNAKAAASFKRALQIQPDDTRAQRGYTDATGNPPP
jgi:serine/threonine protein kinase